MKVLIVNFDNLGDVVFSSHIADTLLRHFPSAQVDVLCSTYAKDIAACYPGVSTVYDLAPPWRATFQQKKGNLLDFLKHLKALRKTNYDVMLCASPHWKDVLGAHMVRAERYVGFCKRAFVRKLLSVPCPVPDDNEPIVQAMQRLVCAAFPDLPENPEPRYRLIPPQGDESEPTSSIVLHPFSGDVRKTWPLENWLELAENLREKHPLRWIGSPTDLENFRNSGVVPVEEIASGTKVARVGDTLKLLSGAKFFIGHDSGPAHMACGLGKAGLALYPPHTARKYYPQGVEDFKFLVGDPISALKVAEVLAGVFEGIEDRAETMTASP